MLKIGLTGGIASGKSTAAMIFQKLGVPIIDADSIARELSQAGSTEFDLIKQEFGNQVIDDNKELDRKKMRKIIFNDGAKKAKLEAILHPAVRRKLLERIKATSAPYCILVIPLLIEAKMLDLVDKIVVIDCLENKQLKRITQRDSCNEEQALNIIHNQLSRQQRLAMADIVVENNETLEQLEKAVRTTHQNILCGI